MWCAVDSRPYVGWMSLPHEASCGEPQWLVHERARDVADGTRLELRLGCPSCGAAHLITVESDSRSDARWGVTRRESTSTHRIGFGGAPQRVCGLFLWPGPAPHASAAPASYAVTTVNERPGCREEIAGSVSRYLTPRRAARWIAAVGYDPAVKIRDGFRSARAAAAWLADQLASGLRPETRGPREAGSGPGPARNGADQ